MPIGTIIGAVIGIAGTIASAAITSRDIEEAQNEGRRLSNIKRDDDLAWKATQARLEKAKIRAREKEFKQGLAFQKEEAKFGRKERALERGMVAREKSFQKPLQLLNQQEALKGNFLNFFQRRAA